MKTVALIGDIAQAAAMIYFVSTFFLADPVKATHRRWVAAGIGAAGFGIKFIK